MISISHFADNVGPILLATDGSSAADAALRAAQQLADEVHRPVRVVAVLEPAPLVAPDYGVLVPPLDSDTVRADSLRARVERQLEDNGTPPNTIPVEIRTGDPATVIAAAAHEMGAAVIVMGLGRHDLLERVFGGETALHTLRRASCPIFCVPENYQSLPKRIAIATDFSRGSAQAASAALSLLPHLSILYLAHVAPPLDLQPDVYAGWFGEYRQGLTSAFEKLTGELTLPANATTETLVLTGQPAKALLEFASAAHLDAIVAGSRGAKLAERLLVGSTATSLIRGARTALILVPNTYVPAPAIVNGEHAEEWSKELQTFTQRNAGRLASLEVDDPEIGAQAQQRGYPFLGAAYDHHDHRVELMLGDQSDAGRHLTRSIGNVRAVDILTDSLGRDTVLRIAHGEGQTILTLVR